MDVFGEAAFKLLKEELLPEIGELRRGQEETAKSFALVFKSFEQINDRFDLVDQRFALMDQRIDDQARTLRALDARLEKLENRVEKLEQALVGVREDMAKLREGMARLSLLGDYVRRVDEMSAELRELRRRQDDMERRLVARAPRRLPKRGA